jgi:hypothetical protein
MQQQMAPTAISRGETSIRPHEALIGSVVRSAPKEGMIQSIRRMAHNVQLEDISHRPNVRKTLNIQES